MKGIVIGATTILAILILTVFILSIQHISYSSIFNKNNKDVKKVIEITEEEPIIKKIISKEKKTDKTEEIREIRTDMILEGKNFDEIAGKIKDIKKSQDEKCCFNETFSRRNNEWISGVEKRCGLFAEKECTESIHNCKFNNDETICKKDIYCEYDNKSNICKNKPEAHRAYDISCSQFDRFRDAKYPNIKYNCENDLLF